MIRKLLLLATFLLTAGVSVQAQNIQFHYDFGRALYSEQRLGDEPRPVLTTTVEMFRPDKWGNTFFFVDMNYRRTGTQLSYWEISREIKLGNSPFLAHVEYNGGLKYEIGTHKGASFNHNYLAGVTYAWNRPDFQAGFTVTPMFKYLDQQKSPASWQLTGTWYYHFAGGLMTTNGFADIWGDRNYVTGKKNIIFLTEPQLWVNLNKVKGVDPNFNLSIGTEVEVSYNFALPEKTVVNPTLAAKWTF